MESLPDDVLHQILQIGLKARRLNHVDICSLAIVNGRFDQLTQDPALWGTLLSRDFPFYSFEAPSKALYERRHRVPSFLFPLSRLNSSFRWRVFSLESVLPALPEERDPVQSNASQPSLKQARNRYYERNLSKSFDKSRPKVIPHSKSYIPMNRPPRSSMPRKI